MNKDKLKRLKALLTLTICLGALTTACKASTNEETEITKEENNDKDFDYTIENIDTNKYLVEEREYISYRLYTDPLTGVTRYDAPSNKDIYKDGNSTYTRTLYIVDDKVTYVCDNDENILREASENENKRVLNALSNNVMLKRTSY